MALGRYKVPRPLKDEDKWFHFFNKRQLISMIVVLVIDWQIILLSSKIGLIVLGIVLAMLLFIIVLVLVMFTMPKQKYLYGGGIRLDLLCIRILQRKLDVRKKIVYARALIDMEDEEA